MFVPATKMLLVKIVYTMHVQICVNPFEFMILTAINWLIDKSGYR